MRLTDHQARAITQLAHELAGERAQVRVFGSRLDDDARGGDLDLILELSEAAASPALLAAQLSARVTRLMQVPQSGRSARRPEPQALAYP